MVPLRRVARLSDEAMGELPGRERGTGRPGTSPMAVRSVSIEAAVSALGVSPQTVLVWGSAKAIRDRPRVNCSIGSRMCSR